MMLFNTHPGVSCEGMVLMSRVRVFCTVPCMTRISCTAQEQNTVRKDTVSKKTAIQRVSLRPRPAPHLKASTTQETASLLQTILPLLKSDSLTDISQSYAILMEIRTRMETQVFSTDEITIAASALGTVLLRSPLKPSDVKLRPVVNRLTSLILDRKDFLDVKDVCLLVWFYGSFGPTIIKSSTFTQVHKALSCLLCKVEEEGIEDLRDVVRLLWGLQKMRYKGHSSVSYPLIKSITSDLNHGLLYPSTSDIASLVLLASKLKVQEGIQLLKSTGVAVKNRFHEFSNQALADLIMGYAIYDYRKSPEVFARCCEELKQRVNEIDVSTFIAIMLNLSKVAYLPDESLLEDFVNQVVNSEGHLTSLNIASCIQALGQLGYCAPKLLNRLLNEFICHLDQYSTTQICTVLLNCARLQYLDEKRLVIGLGKINEMLPEGMSKTDRMCLHQVFTYSQLFIKTPITPEIFPLKWQQACRTEWENVQKKPVMKKASEIVSVVRLLGLEVCQGTSDVGQLLIQYVISPKDQQKVVFDLIHPKSHCFMNNEEILLPWKEWHHAMLEEQGYRVLCLTEMEWKEVPRKRKVRYLAEKLGFWTSEEIEQIENSLVTTLSLTSGFRDESHLLEMQ